MCQVQTRLVSEGGAGGNAESFPKATAVFVPKGEMVIIYLTMFINMCVCIYIERERDGERDWLHIPLYLIMFQLGCNPNLGHGTPNWMVQTMVLCAFCWGFHLP
jgi:hypothetical protein